MRPIFSCFLIYIFIQPPVFGVLKKTSCRTSQTDRGYLNRGQVDTECKFPFTIRGKAYYQCTYDYSHITGYKPWCSTKTDENNKHVSGGANWGVCDDTEKCSIPPFYCGEPVRTRPLPDVDGIDNEVEIEQMPWMVSLGTFKSRNHWNHECGGSLITNRHVLTAAHCLVSKKGRSLKQYRMRLGASDLWSSTEGITRKVDQVLIHPLYNHPQAYYDVGIVVADKIIDYSDRVMPICLPMSPVDDDDALVDDFVNLAGWGYDYEDGVRKLNNKLKLASLQVNPKDDCEDRFSLESIQEQKLRIPPFKLAQTIPYGFTSDLSCVGNDFGFDQGACEGDSGSPVIKRISETSRGKPFFEQHFIVSTGIHCDLKATIYVRVTERRVLNWIQEVTDTRPLIMVVGGFSALAKNGITNDVELISTRPNRACSKFAKKIIGNSYNISGQIVRDSEVLAPTGQFAKQSPIVCGGKNAFNNLETCFEFNTAENKWNQIPSMNDKRHYAASVLDQNGNLWVIGGHHDSQAAGSTEVYEYKAPPREGRWRRGYPLPSELRDTGLSDHCAVKLNSTHVFIAGGFARAFKVCDPLKTRASEEGVGVRSDSNSGSFDIRDGPEVPTGSDPIPVEIASACGDETESVSANDKVGGGRVLSKAWMYDEFEWKPLPDMSTTRDRPACSLVQLANGGIRIIVAGGCKDWCVENPPIASAEMYNPETGEWTKIADLPEPLSSSRMEQFDGLPTIIGGFNGTHQIGTLYQYHPEEDQWIPHPVEMRLPRSSAAVFQVPKHLFRNC